MFLIHLCLNACSQLAKFLACFALNLSLNYRSTVIWLAVSEPERTSSWDCLSDSVLVFSSVHRQTMPVCLMLSAHILLKPSLLCLVMLQSRKSIKHTGVLNILMLQIAWCLQILQVQEMLQASTPYLQYYWLHHPQFLNNAPEHLGSDGNDWSKSHAIPGSVCRNSSCLLDVLFQWTGHCLDRVSWTLVTFRSIKRICILPQACEMTCKF